MPKLWRGDDGKLICSKVGLCLSEDCPEPGPSPEECVDVPCLQIDEDSRTEPHYSIHIASVPSHNYDVELYATGSADDCLEVVANGVTLYTDHDPERGGVTHSYHNTMLCVIPANTSAIIYLWDTAYMKVKWNGSFCIKRAIPDEFE